MGGRGGGEPLCKWTSKDEGWYVARKGLSERKVPAGRMFHVQQSKKVQPLVHLSPASGDFHQQPVKWGGSNSRQPENQQRIASSKV